MKQKSLIELVDEAGDIITFEDGFKRFKGLSANDLRVIADELDRRNSEWKSVVDREIGGKTPGEKLHDIFVQEKFLIDIPWCDRSQMMRDAMDMRASTIIDASGLREENERLKAQCQSLMKQSA